MRLMLSLLLSFFVLPVAIAQALPSPAPAFPSSTVGNVTTYGSGSASAANAGSWSFPNAANGPVYGQSSGSLSLPGGRSAPVTVRATLPPSTYGPALARFAGRLVPAVMVGMAIKGLMDDLGYVKTGSGFGKVDPSSCTVGPCYEWNDHASGLPGGAQWHETIQSAAARRVAYFNAFGLGGGGWSLAGCWYTTYPAGMCSWTRPNGSGQDGFGYQTRTPDLPGQYLPATQQELADAIASKSGWPTGSKIGDAIKEAIQQGETISVPQPSEVTGPASVVGPSTTSTTVHRDAAGNPTGTTTVTNNTTYNLNYGPNSVTTTVTNTTTTVKPDGTTDTKTDSEPVEEAMPSDTPLGSLPKLYERKYPDGLSGVWQQKKAALTSSPLLSLVSGLMPSVGLTGTCPILMINLDVGFQNFGSHDFAPPCWIWDFGRIVVIASALLLARALIFGG